MIQLIALISAMAITGFKPFPMVLTAVALIGAITVMFFDSSKAIFITTGLLLIVYGVSEVVSLFRVRKAEEIYIIRYGATKEAQESRTSGGETLLVTGAVKEVKPEEEK